MKKLIYILIFLSFYHNAYSQLYDLIITSKSDSIACRIDSITDSYIYFEMKIQNNWIHTNIDRNDVADFSYNKVDIKDVLFKSGSSYISNRVLYKKNHTIHCDIGTIFFVGYLSINYEVTLKKSDNSNMRLKTGLLHTFDTDSYGVPLCLTTLFGKTNNYFELTFGAAPRILLNSQKEGFGLNGFLSYQYSIYPILDIGYRHEPDKGNFFYRFQIGSTGLGVGAGFSF